MRRALKWLGGIVLVLLLLPIVLVGGLLLALNTEFGTREVETLTARLTSGMVVLRDVSGTFPQAPRVGHAEIRDERGVWLTLDEIALDWSPTRLIGKDVQVERLEIGRVAMARLPVSSAPSSPSSSPFSLPVRVDIDHLHVGRVDIAAPVAGVAASLSIDGAAHVASLADGRADLTLRRLDGEGTYTVKGRIDPRTLAADIVAQEPANGLIAGIAALPNLGALDLHAAVDGPWNAAATDVTLTAGPLRAAVKGTVDIDGRAADLDVTANAPAMAPRPDVTWQAVALDAHVHGPFTKPDATGTLLLDGLAAAGASVRHLAADVTGDSGRISLKASIEGLRVPGPKPDLMEGAPVLVTADARLDAADRPVVFHVSHPLLDAQGTAHTGGDIDADTTLMLPDLAPFAAAGGVDLRGHTTLRIKAAKRGDTTTADIDGTLGITGGVAPAPALVGPDATIGVTASMRGGDMTLSRLDVKGATVDVNATGGLTDGKIALAWNVALSDLHALAASVEGALRAQGNVAGTTGDFATQADISGDFATKGFRRAPVKVALHAQGLPGAPTGTVTAEAMLEGAPLSLDANANRAPDGTLQVDITRAAWKSAQIDGAATLAAGATLPDGKLALRIGRLADLDALAGMSFAGSLESTLELAPGIAHLVLNARNAGVTGNDAAEAKLDATVTDPLTKPAVRATLAIDGLRAGAVEGSAKLDLDGPENAVALRLATTLRNFNGGDLQGNAAGRMDVPTMQLELASLQANWKGQNLRLLAPTRITLKDGIAVDRLRLGLQQAVLELAGRISPTLDLTASLRGVTPDLARAIAPDIQADGELQADARITGTPVAPAGTVRLTATGLHMRTGPARALPPAAVTANATLGAGSARIDTRVTAGRNTVTVTGTVPLATNGAMNLQAQAEINLALLDPILSAQGRRIRGQVSLNAGLTGTFAAPRASGTLRLANGDVQDFTQGARIDNIQALVEATGDSVRIASFTGRAGRGTVSISGSIGLAAPMPIDVAVTMRNASPLSGDKLKVVLNSDLTLRGAVSGQLALAGAIHIVSAAIQVPETLPATLAVLNVRRPGDKPPPPPSAPLDITLDLAIDAPGQIFVRGRGLDAELAGNLRIRGTTAAPQPTGSFKMRRGTFSLAGQSLTFTTGEVGFDGSGKIDPSLNFVASSTSGNITATLTVTGYASAPKIALSSVPEVPQDEVLARLLFHQSAASLGPFQLAAIAAGLAQISGVGGAGGFDPLGSVRSGLGLDRLSVGGGSGNSATVEAGKYIANGVYVGAKQSTSGSGTQATVQVDLYKGLKLETTVGTGGGTATGSSSTDSNGTSVGLTYQFEY